MILGIAWYRENQWELLKSTASDPEAIEDTYEEWVQKATKAIKRMKKPGVELLKVDFDVIQFNEWCRANPFPHASLIQRVKIYKIKRRTNVGVKIPLR